MQLMRRMLMGAAAAVVLRAGARAAEIVSPVPGKRVALQGYDPVAYFTDGRPILGDAHIWYEFDDTVYIFATTDHRAAFVGDPDHFAPQFRGFCTISVSEGGKDEGLAQYWKIVDGTLFVFGKDFGPDMFAKDPTGIMAKARANWASLKSQ